jgi:4-aminobutyrate aminotransferase-like enzyme
MAALSAGLKSVPLMGEIRGKGLMMGIELVKDGNKTPAPEVAEGIRSKCLEHGVLIGVGGIYGNVLRIQPPLTITKEQFDTALGILLKILPEARHASA